MPEPAAPLAKTAMTAQTLLGFDFGTRRIGVAVGQRVTGTSRALTTLTAREGQPDWAQVEQLIATWRPDALVVGLPLALDGSRSEVTAAAERFARRLHGRFRLPVHMQDERLSSYAAEQLTEGSRRDRLDATAARIILQDWLDAQGEAHATDR